MIRELKRWIWSRVMCLNGNHDWSEKYPIGMDVRINGKWYQDFGRQCKVCHKIQRLYGAAWHDWDGIP